MRRIMPHQQEALRFLRKHKLQGGLFMAPGTGKTLVAIRALKRLGGLKLVICRRDDFFTWESELNMEGISSDHIEIIHKGNHQIRWRGMWYLVTYDLLKNPAICKQLFDKVWISAVIADECHSIRHWESARTKAVVRWTARIPKRIGMTGSPFGNDPGDVFSQCLYIDGGKTFGDNWWRFRTRYYLKSGPGWYIRSRAKEDIKRRLKQIAFYVHEDDVLDLPPLRHITKAVPLSGMQRRHYKKLLEDWETTIDGERIEVDQVIVQLIKLRQIASGFMYNNGKILWLRSTKLKLLESMLKDEQYLALKSKVVIWCAFTAEIIRVKKLAGQLKIKAVEFRGSNLKKKNQARKQFRDDPDTKLFIGQVDSGVGMNELIVADTAIYFSNSLKVISRLQSMRRTRRKGSDIHRNITYYDLLSEHSIDISLLHALDNHRNLADYILEGIRRGKRISRILK